MSEISSSSAAVLFALLLIPIGIFLVVRASVKHIQLRFCLALLVAVIAGATSYYLAVHHGWRPSFKGGGRLNLDPLAIGVGHFILMFVVFTLLHFRLGGARAKK